MLPTNKLYSLSPTYFNHWNKKQPKLETLETKDYKVLWIDVLETKRQGRFGKYVINPYIQSKELYPLIVPLKAFEPKDKIAFEWNGNEYELDALVYGISVGISVGAGVGIGIGIGVGIGIGIGVQNNGPNYTKTYKWKEFQEIFEQSGEQYCLYDCLVFPEIGGKPIRTLVPWFMMKEAKEKEM